MACITRSPSFVRQHRDGKIELSANRPHVIMFSGVNGSGKTTIIGKIANKFKKDGIYNKVIKTSDSKYAVVYVYNTDKTNLESEIKENLTSLSDISTKMETHYLRKYNFDVYEEALKDEIEETNEDYFG